MKYRWENTEGGRGVSVVLLYYISNENNIQGKNIDSEMIQCGIIIYYTICNEMH